MSELHVVATIPVKPEAVDQVRPALTELVAATRGEEGCLAYDLFESAAAPGTFVTVERWTDQAALDAHMATPHVAAAVRGRPAARSTARWPSTRCARSSRSVRDPTRRHAPRRSARGRAPAGRAAPQQHRSRHREQQRQRAPPRQQHERGHHQRQPERPRTRCRGTLRLAKKVSVTRVVRGPRGTGWVSRARPGPRCRLPSRPSPRSRRVVAEVADPLPGASPSVGGEAGADRAVVVAVAECDLPAADERDVLADVRQVGAEGPGAAVAGIRRGVGGVRRVAKSPPTTMPRRGEARRTGEAAGGLTRRDPGLDGPSR